MDTRIYVMTHKKYEKPEDDLYQMLHVGRDIGEDLGYLGDNSGNHISNKNKSYCELTGLYWIWKNISCDIVGLCHYRRYFMRGEGNPVYLTKEYIENTLKEYDCIVPQSTFTQHETVYDHYKTEHYESDMQICHEVMVELYPEYEDAYQLCMHCNLFTLGNMMITRKEILDQYCEWLFSILFEVERRTDISNYDTYQARLYGYLAERLLRIWLIKNDYRIREEKVNMVIPREMDEQHKLNELKLKCVETILKGMIADYQAGNMVDCVDCSPFPIDFGGRIPIWICWWQGYDAAPELVRRCICSVQNYIPEEKAELHFITMQNVGEYITLPDWIVRKFGEQKITLTHLSDILRFALLYRYGGLWLDATYYMTGPFFDEILDADTFYSIRLPKTKWRYDITQGRWAGNLLYGKAGNPLFRFMLNGFYEYWCTQDEMLDYYLIDYMIEAAYRNLPYVKEMLDAVPVNNPEVLSLDEIMNSKYNEKTWAELVRETKIFKLSNKRQYFAKTMVEEKTFWGKILEL